MLEIDFFSGPFAFLSLSFQDPLVFEGKLFNCPLDALRSGLAPSELLDPKRLSGALHCVLLDRFIRNPASLRDLSHTVGRPVIWRLSESGDESADFNRYLSPETLNLLGVSDNGQGENMLGMELMDIRALSLNGSVPEPFRGGMFGLLPAWLNATLSGLSDPVPLDICEYKDGIKVDEHRLRKPFIIFGKNANVSDVVAAHPSISRVHAIVLIDSSPQLVVIDLGSKSGTRVSAADEWVKLDPFMPHRLELTSSSEVLIRLGQSSREYTVKREDERVVEELESRLREHQGLSESDDGDLCLFIGNLPFGTTERDIGEILDPAGIRSVHLLTEKRCAFVDVVDNKWMNRYLLQNGVQFNDCRISVKRKLNR